MKRRKLWKTGEDGLCCSSSAIQTRLDPSSLLEERSETPSVFVCFFCVVGYPPNWGKRPRYIDRIERYFYPTMGRNIGKKGRNGILPGRKHSSYQSNVHGICSFLG